MIPDKMARQIEREMKKSWTPLIKRLKRSIGDDYRASDQDDKPSMNVVVGITPRPSGEAPWFSWGYQTGDPSYTGGAYGHPIWANVAIHRKSSTPAVVDDIIDQAFDGLVEAWEAWSKEAKP